MRHNNVIPAYAGIQLTKIFKWIPAFAGTTVVLYLLFFQLTTAVFAQQATLSLSPTSGTFNKGCAFSLDILLDTGGAQTDGTDAILTYDVSRLTATSITPGTIYPDYPGNSIREDLGKVTISGLASVTSAFSGKGTLAKVNFAVKETAPTGLTQVKFDFDANNKTNTTDSNVVQRGTSTVADILGSVTNGSYTVGSGVCGGTGATQISTPSGQVVEIPLKTLPPAGSETLTYTIAIMGGILTLLGVLGLVLL